MEIKDLKKLLQQKKVKWTIPNSLNENLNINDLGKLNGLGANLPSSGDLTARLPKMRRMSKTFFPFSKTTSLLLRESAPTLPERWDWRDVQGNNYVSPPKNQGSCNSCVAFATIATLESHWRIENNNPDININFSEGALFFIPNRRCEGGWNVSASLDFLVDEGACLEENLPYRPVNQTAEFILGAELTNKISGFDSTTQIDQMKRWICEEGPLIATFDVFTDFDVYWRGGANGVYTYVTGDRRGGHAISIIGYDDNENCWICKNSWGNGGDGGCFRIGYNQCGINRRMYLIQDVYDVITKDEISYNPRTLRVVNEGSKGWLLTDGRSRLKMLDNKEDARNALRVARRHTKNGFIGRSNPRTNRIDYISEYWTGNSGLSYESLTKVDGIPYNPSNITAEDLDGKGWRIKEGNNWMLLADDMNDALSILRVAQRHSRMCFIGRGNKRSNRKSYIMTYWE